MNRLVDFQVLQRGPDGTAKAELHGPCSTFGPVNVTVNGRQMAGGHSDGSMWRASLMDIQTGGPYDIAVEKDGLILHSAQNVYVGDLWILAGQSNMEGYGDLTDVERPEAGIHVFDMADTWRLATEPLHWLCDSLDSAHYEPYGNRDPEYIAEAHRTRAKGAGLGLSFAKALKDADGVPIGLIPCAQGGTVLPQWDPKRRDEGGASLYGAMIRRARESGGRVAGILWYQGESDAMGRESHLYGDRFEAFVASLRDDLGDPRLPVHTVQLGRFILPADWDVAGAEEWNPLQDLQRLLPERIPNLFVVPAIDLDLEDGIHISTPGLRKLGKRLARSVMLGAPAVPRLRSVEFEAGSQHILLVKFDCHRPLVLPASNRLTGFSIQDSEGREISYIFRSSMAEGSNCIRLELIADLPEGWSLWYGRGLDPACFLRDDADMPVPVFGPIDPRSTLP